MLAADDAATTDSALAGSSASMRASAGLRCASPAAGTGTVVVHAGDNRNRRIDGALELTDMFAPSSLERLFRPLGKPDASHRHEHFHSDTAPARTPLAAVFAQFHHPFQPSLQQPQMQQPLRQMPPSGQKQETDDAQMQAALPARLLRGTDDTWTRGQLSALMSALEAPDDAAAANASSHINGVSASAHSCGIDSGSASGSRRSADSGASNSLLPDPLALEQPLPSHPTANQHHPSTDPTNSATTNFPNTQFVGHASLRHVLSSFDTSSQPVGVASVDTSSAGLHPAVAPAAEPLTSLQQISSQLYPDDIDFLDDLEEAANSGDIDHPSNNIPTSSRFEPLGFMDSARPDLSIQSSSSSSLLPPLPPLTSQPPHNPSPSHNQRPSIPPHSPKSHQKPEYGSLGHHLPQRAPTLVSSNMSSQPMLSSSLEDAAAEIQRHEPFKLNRRISGTPNNNNNNLREMQHRLQKLRLPGQTRNEGYAGDVSANGARSVQHGQNLLDKENGHGQESSNQTEPDAQIQDATTTTTTKTPTAANKATMTPDTEAARHAVVATVSNRATNDQSQPRETRMLGHQSNATLVSTPAQTRAVVLRSDMADGIHTLSSPHGHVLDLSRRGLAMLKGVIDVQDRPRRIQLSDNALTYLSDVPDSVEVLYLAHNCISDLTSFSHLRALRCIDVSRNNLSDLSALACLGTLRELDASFNRIDAVQSILRLASLTRLDLQHNQIGNVNFQASDLPRLLSLNLSYNRIRHMKSVHRLASIQELCVESNLLRSFAPSRPMPKLKTLNLAYNRILAFSGTSFPSLVGLNLDGNRVAEIDDPEEMCSLEVLSMESQVTDDQTVTITGLDTIREIRVACNLVGDLAHVSGPYLEVFECRDAHIETIPPSISSQSSALRRLVLSGNRIDDIRPLAGLESLQELDVSRNWIWDIGVVLATLRRLGSLRSFDLRFNPITEQFYGEGGFSLVSVNDKLMMVQQQQQRQRQQHDGAAMGPTHHVSNGTARGQSVPSHNVCQIHRDGSSSDLAQHPQEDAHNARIVREICYRSAVISAMRRTVEVLDQTPVTREDRHQARRRIRTLKEFLQSQRRQQRSHSQIPRELPRRESSRDGDGDDGMPPLHRLHYHGQHGQLDTSMSLGVNDPLLPASSASTTDAPIASSMPFSGWTPKSFPLGDITADDQLFVDFNSMLQFQQQQ